MALLWGCPSHIEVKLAVAVLLTWLILGISLPLIQIEAKIESLQFQFLSETIRFTDQILFHQSKSILDVIHLLLLKGKTPSTAGCRIRYSPVQCPHPRGETSRIVCLETED